MKKVILFLAVWFFAACTSGEVSNEDVRWTTVTGISSMESFDYIDSTTKTVDIVSVRDGVHVETDPDAFSIGENVLLVKTAHGFSLKKGDFDAYLSQVQSDGLGGIFCVIANSDTVSLPGDLPVGRKITITIFPNGTYAYELHSNE